MYHPNHYTVYEIRGKTIQKNNLYLQLTLANISISCYYKASPLRTYVLFRKGYVMFKKMSHYDHIAAIIPCYTAEGDTTAIISTNGSYNAINTRIRTVLSRLARSRAIGLIVLKQKAAQATDRSMLQPLSLAPGLVLCPLKLRLPRVAGDTTTGYINFHAVTDVTPSGSKPYQSTITLTGGTKLPVLWTPGTVKKHLQHARLALSCTAHDPEIPPEMTSLIHNLVKSICSLLIAKRSLE